jgi:hypothetical protein
VVEMPPSAETPALESVPRGLHRWVPVVGAALAGALAGLLAGRYGDRDRE